MAPPPPPPASSEAPNTGIMGGGYNQQPPQQQSYYSPQPEQPQPSYYAQQPPPSQPPQQPPPPPPPQQVATPGGYAARSAAAHSPQRPTTSTAYNNTNNTISQHSSNNNLSNAAANAANTAAAAAANSPLPNPTLTPPRKRYEETPFQAAEQSRLLTNSLQRLTESSYQMQHSMEMNDVVTTLEQACLLLEELGDPNHGVRGGGANHHRPQQTPPSYYSTAGGAVPPLGNYNDRYYTGQSQQLPGGGNGNNNMNGNGGNNNNNSNNGIIALLSPKNYYELHMRAMDEMPILEEFLLGLCHSMDATSSSSTTGGPTNAMSHIQATASSLSPYTCNQLYETVQYCPRVVPRLYLQICMGSVSIRTGNSKAVDVMKELSDAAKCVQCPVRGLFLRYYLLMALKDKLPDVGKHGEEDNNDEEAKEEESDLLEAEGTTEVVDDNVTTPTLPPPSLPPPPPPMEEDSHLLSPSHEEDPLFSDSPLDEPPQQQVNVPPTTTTAAKSTPTTTDSATANATSNTTTPLLGKGTVVDSYEFILQNLLEMNRLWIRIQHMPGDKTKETKRRRERERNDLRILVGSNLNRLSQLEGISAHTYGSTILPRILQEVASCRDPLAQAYLMDCIIQVFPDEFHLETLEVFLGVLPKLRDKVNTRTILNNMMERLLHYYQDETLVNGELDTNDVKRTMAVNSFDMFEDCVQRVFEARGLNIPPKDVIRLQGCLLNYALKISPGNIDLISRCIGMCAGALGTLKEQKKASMMGQGIVVGGGTKKSSEIDMEAVATGALESLLSVPLEQLALKVLDLPDFSTLMSFLPWENRKVVALSMIKSVVAGGDGAKVKDIAQLEQLLEILAPLLRDKGASGPVVYEPTVDDGGSLISRTANLMGTLGISPSGGNDMFDGGLQKAESFGGDSQKFNQFREEQTLIAKLVHVLDHEDTDIAYQMLNVVRKHITPGGPKRAGMTLPPIIFAALMLLRRVQALEFPPPVAPKKDTEVKEESKDTLEPDAKESEDGNESKDAATSDDKDEKPAEDETETKDGDNEDAEATEAAAENGETAERDGGDESKEDATEEEPAAEKPAPLFATFSKTVNCRKILVFLQKTAAILAPINPELAFKLYLEIAAATDLLAYSIKPSFESSSNDFSSISYDFLTQAFLVYEDEITESSAQVRAITSIVGTLLSCRTFEKTDYEALITKTAQYSAKLLKKPDQCRMVCLCSRLFYAGGKDAVNTYHNPQRVLECLQRGLKIADACSRQSSANIQLFVEILDYYVYYYEVGNPAITDKFVSGLIALVNEHLQSVGVTSSVAVAETKAHYGQIVDLIKKKKVETETAERFGLIVC
eukprot:CAMPEP_0113382090 /NCGR_PEP_ID=MMETSP0013_2-20120614/5651_1 /TAXON_ID=2843 ORGANISM="Skeletonema costatum, Strain 1716" /NCGR_SAMPLE_ID=MMETSP0013_2 /ASSEMBLY_ACC=CAM_ASM_000158 /LENGTH=1333 /DNA_ID=CAMNT_0000264563 /DNA_START=196 /DNA_END=4197 /DNA_ORIENTATION=- /assembly_acc=CAM_ASM_000158